MYIINITNLQNFLQQGLKVWRLGLFTDHDPVHKGVSHDSVKCLFKTKLLLLSKNISRGSVLDPFLSPYVLENLTHFQSVVKLLLTNENQYWQNSVQHTM